MSKHQKHDEGGTSSPIEGVSPEKEEAAVPENREQASGNDDLTALSEKYEAVIKAQEQKLAELSLENSDLKDQYLRKLADYENFRKRMFRERDDTALYANANLLSDLVAVIDDFDRAVQSSEASQSFKNLHDGVVMIRQSLLSLLENKYALKRYESVGLEFDPNIHEAVMSEQGDCESPVVVEEFMRGYKLHDRVIRSAKVKVHLPAAGSSIEDQAEPGL